MAGGSPAALPGFRKVRIQWGKLGEDGSAEMASAGSDQSGKPAGVTVGGPVHSGRMIPVPAVTASHRMMAASLQPEYSVVIPAAADIGRPGTTPMPKRPMAAAGRLDQAVRLTCGGTGNAASAHALVSFDYSSLHRLLS
jgi:hypothetical protein